MLLSSCLLALLFVRVRAAECPQHCKCTRYLHFINCIKVSLIEVPRLTTTTEITILNLSHNNITSLKDGVFLRSNMVNISVIDLFANNITIIERDAFRGLSEHLLDLSLGSNPFLKLPEDGFELKTLTLLDMSSCNLKSIPPKFFQEMQYITYLYLTDNKLTVFDPFIVNLQLERLFLDENNITRLDSRMATFQQIEFSIDGNPFHCDCEFLQTLTALAKRQTPHLKCRTPAYLQAVSGERLLRMSLKCDDHGELVPSLEDRSWWFLHQWWILSVCALGVVFLAVLAHVFRNHEYSLNILDRLRTLRKFASFRSNVNNSRDMLVD